MRTWKAERQRDRQTSGRGTFVPLVFKFSEDWAIIAGRQTRLQVARTKLSHSRAFIVRAYPLQTHEMLFDALTQAFRGLGGVPQRGIFDNMRTAVDRIGSGKARQLAERLLRLDLIILDELGYLPFGPSGDALLFHLPSKLHKRTSVIITTNLSFSEWTDVFGDAKPPHPPLPHPGSR